MEILVADDNEIVRETLVDLLDQMGHSITQCRDGVTALALLNSQPFDLLITDIRMPGLSGIEVAESIQKQSDLDLPVIIITGSDEYWGLDALLAHPRVLLLRKPLRIANILDAINKLTIAQCAS